MEAVNQIQGKSAQELSQFLLENMGGQVERASFSKFLNNLIEENIDGGVVQHFGFDTFVQMGCRKGDAKRLEVFIKVLMTPPAPCKRAMQAEDGPAPVAKKTRKEQGSTGSRSHHSKQQPFSTEENKLKSVSNKELRKELKMVFPNYIHAKFHSKYATNLEKKKAVINKLYGLQLSEDDRVLIKAKIGTTLTGMRQRLNNATKKPGNGPLFFGTGSMKVVLHAYEDKLSWEDLDFFEKLQEARMRQPEYFLEQKACVATGYFCGRAASKGSDHEYRVVQVKVMRILKNDQDFRIPFASDLAPFMEKMPRRMSSIREGDYIYWPECCLEIVIEHHYDSELDDVVEVGGKEDDDDSGEDSESDEGVDEEEKKTISLDSADSDDDEPLESIRLKQQVNKNKTGSTDELVAGPTLEIIPDKGIVSEDLTGSNETTQGQSEVSVDVHKLPMHTLKFMASVLMNKPEEKVNLLAVKSYCAAYNSRTAPGTFRIKSTMKTKEALESLVRSALEHHLLVVREAAWTDNVWNTDTVFVNDTN